MSILKSALVLAALVAFTSPGFPQTRSPASSTLTELAIGRLTFFDFGPPFEYYEIFVVQQGASGTSVDRVTLTPGSDVCFMPSRVEMASARIAAPMSTLVADENPCAVPEKDLSRELKRCKKCMTFSGARVSMRVRCGDNTRILRSGILDRDMFDPYKKTPPNTTWTMGLIDRLDAVVGPGVMQKPIFTSSKENDLPDDASASPVLAAIAAGEYDSLFAGEENRPSAIYRAAMQSHPATMTVELQDSTVKPVVFTPPVYPAIAKLARVQGTVSIAVLVDSNGATNVLFPALGPPLLRSAVESAASGWVFPRDMAHKLVNVEVRFSINCPPANP
ncbi:MAG TPA: energy transducer TonB [Candidatus Aquilonibacter sp.]|nr:energy transducer TonB [Candidatus Aquilonibacter sp.]